jgi:hypothetical protein
MVYTTPLREWRLRNWPFFGIINAKKRKDTISVILSRPSDSHNCLNPGYLKKSSSNP